MPRKPAPRLASRGLDQLKLREQPWQRQPVRGEGDLKASRGAAYPWRGRRGPGALGLYGGLFWAGAAVCIPVDDGARAEQDQGSPLPIVVADFESQRPGFPVGWKYLHERRLVPFGPRFNRPNERFLVARNPDSGTCFH